MKKKMSKKSNTSQKQKESTLYIDNLETIRLHDPILANKIDVCPLGINYEMKGTGKDNYVNVYSKLINRYYYDENNPVEGVRKQLSGLNIKNSKIALFLGFGLGIEVDIFAKEFSEKTLTHTILIIEKDIELFKIALHMFDYRPMLSDPKIKLIVGVETHDFLPLLIEYLMKDNKVIYSKAIVPIYMDASIMAHKEYYLQCLKEITTAVPFVLRYFGNSPDDSLIGVENMLENIDEIIKNPGIKMIYDKFIKKPAIIVATGPSLSKNRHLLVGLEDKAVIISVDASLKILKDIGVTPHMVTSLERIPETAELMSGFEYEDVKDVYYAACPVIPKEAYEAYPGPRLIVYRNFDHFKWIDLDKGILDIKHSSANMAFKIAESLGCDPIILVGQDLAYSREGKSHSEGAFYGEEQFQYKTSDDNGKKWVMGNDGQMIQTHLDWDEFRKAYEVDIASYSGTCINATEGGAFINGTKVMSLQEAINQNIKEVINPLEVIKTALKEFTREEETKDFERIVLLIENTQVDLKQIQEICIEAHNEVKKVEEEFELWMSESDKVFSEEFSRKIEEMHNFLLGKKREVFAVQPTMQLFMMHIFQPFYVKSEMECHAVPGLYNTDEEIQIATIILHKRFFTVLHDLINVCNQSLRNTLDKLSKITI